MTNNSNGPKSNPAIKSKLFKLKEWLTVPEAASHLSIVFGEEVNEADVLRLALDGHLILSVNFINGAYARHGKIVRYEEAERMELPMPQWVKEELGSPPEGHEMINTISVITGLSLDRERILELKDDVKIVRQVWDLPMIGAERLDVEHKYQQLTGGPEVTLVCMDGVLIETQSGEVWQLQEEFDKEFLENRYGEEGIRKSLAFSEKLLKKKIINNEIDEKEAGKLLEQRKQNLNKKRKFSDDFYPAGGLPDDSVLVVRTSTLLDLQERLTQEKSEKKKPLGPRAEKTYLNIIGAMLEILKGDHGKVNFTSETDLKDFLVQKFDGFSGISERTLSEKFALAKKTLNEELD